MQVEIYKIKNFFKFYFLMRVKDCLAIFFHYYNIYFQFGNIKNS